MNKLILLILLFTFNSMAQLHNTTVKYTLGMSKPSSHLFEVKINIDNLDTNDNHLDLIMPVWRPGRYLIFDFAGGVQEFSAGELKWNKTDKMTWRIETNGATKIEVAYKVYANEFLLRTRGLDSTHAFVDGTAVFMYAKKYRDIPLTLHVMAYSDWHVTSGLDVISENEELFYAPNYDYFVDCPLEIGEQVDFDFEVAGKKHTISIYGEAKYDKFKMIKDITTIIEKEHEFWGSIPYEHYTIQIHVMPGNGGGTEHINSTILGATPKTFEDEKAYKNFLRLVSHEFFHTWNVKRLRPKGIARYDYTKENYMHELWVSEGGTSYYDGLIITRTKQQTVEDFYKEITSHVQDERRRPGNGIQSVSESSFDAWIKFWKRAPNAYDSESDYYGKGADVNLLLDLALRQMSSNQKSLDDVYRRLYELYPLGSSGFTNDDMQKICEEFTNSTFEPFFRDYVWGTKPLEWETYLGYAGLDLKAEESIPTPILGLQTSNKTGKILVDSVLAKSSAEKSGVKAGDEIIALDGAKMSYAEMENKIKGMKTGDALRLTVFRENKLREFRLTLEDIKIPNYTLTKVSSPTDLQKAIYERWLEEKW